MKDIACAFCQQDNPTALVSQVDEHNRITSALLGVGNAANSQYYGLARQV